ncbi:MAG: TetR family transcriptional regulator [Rhizomicrobium sp.]
MAKRAPREANKEVARVWQQRTTRAAILEAARRLAVRDDASELTLARVADEADFSPNTVYAYFVNKNELMLAIVAEDLAALAREMRDVFPANEDVDAEVDDEIAPDEATQNEKSETSEVSADDAEASDAGQSVDAQPTDPVGEPVEDAALEVEPVPEEEVAHEADATSTLETVPDTALENKQDVSPEADDSEHDDHNPDSSVEDTAEPAVDTLEDIPTRLELKPEDDTAPECAAPSAPEATPEISLETEPQDSVDADDAPVEHDPVPQSDVRPANMPLVEKKWVSQSDSDRGEETAAAVARLAESVAKLEVRPVDAWLERRLRELERMITSLEERQGNTERNSGTASGVIDESVRGLQTRLEAVEKNQSAASDNNAKALGERADASEKRLRDMFGELRSLVLLSSSRLDVLEGDARKRTPYELIEVAPEAETPPAAADVLEADTTVENADAPVEAAPSPVSETSYLSQARRSAMAAAAQTVAQPTEPMQRFASTMSSIKTASSRTRNIVAGGMALLLVLLGAGLVLNRHAAGESRAQQFQVAAAPHAMHARLAERQTMAPQIRLASLAGRGNADAELLLGLEYLDGTGAAKNEGAAAQWIARSAARGNAIAQFWLGNLYANGRGLKADPALAMHWYEEAAMQGNRKAMHQLAVSYAEGWGATTNYSEAARWFSRAASLGYVDSAFNLGVLYERGLGVPQSLLDAYKWYAIASTLGDKGSLPRIAILKTQMSPTEISDATQAANGFSPDAIDQAANTTPQIAQLPKS